MPLAALPALSAATLALAASAAPLSPAPPQPHGAAGRQPRARPHGHRRDRPRRAARGDLRAAGPSGIGVEWHDAVRAAKRIGGPRGAVVRQSVTSTQRLAATGALRAGRLAAAIAGAHASAEVARSDRPLPAPGGRVRLPGDSIVYSYRPPYGMQVHPLGTIGKLNALATTCTDAGTEARLALPARGPARRRRPPHRGLGPGRPDPPLRVPVRLRRRAPRLGVGDDPGDRGPGARAHRGHQRRAALRGVGPRRLPGAHPTRAARRRRDGRRRPDRPLRHVLVPAADARAQRRGAVAHRRGRLRPHHATTRSPPGSPAAARASSRRACRPSTPARGRSTTSAAPRPTSTTTGSRRGSPRASARARSPAASARRRRGSPATPSSRRSWRCSRREADPRAAARDDRARRLEAGGRAPRRPRPPRPRRRRPPPRARPDDRAARAAGARAGDLRGRAGATAINGRAAQRAVTFVATSRRRSRSRSRSTPRRPKHEDRGADGAKPVEQSAADQGSAKRTKPGS